MLWRARSRQQSLFVLLSRFTVVKPQYMLIKLHGNRGSSCNGILTRLESNREDRLELGGVSWESWLHLQLTAVSAS